MKSHDCHVLMTQILPVAIRGIMDAHVRETLFGLCNFFDVISRKSVGVRQLRRLQEEIVVILCELEMYFPPAFFDVMVHLLVHIVEDIIQLGPTFLHSMMPFERMNGVIKGYVRNRARPDGSIAKGFLTEECISFCTSYLEIENPVGLPVNRHLGKLAGWGHRDGSREMHVDFKGRIADFERANLVALQHIDVVDPWVVEHKTFIAKTYSDQGQQRTDGDIIKEHNSTFTRWFKDKMLTYPIDEDSSAEEKLIFALSQGAEHNLMTFQAYDINGYTFYTEEKDMKSDYQNSGVTMESYTGDVKQRYYGKIEEIWELSYAGENVPMFRVRHFTTMVIPEAKSKTAGAKVTEKYEPWVLASQVDQCFFITDPQKPCALLLSVSGDLAKIPLLFPVPTRSHQQQPPSASRRCHPSRSSPAPPPRRHLPGDTSDQTPRYALLSSPNPDHLLLPIPNPRRRSLSISISPPPTPLSTGPSPPRIPAGDHLSHRRRPILCLVAPQAVHRGERTPPATSSSISPPRSRTSSTSDAACDLVLDLTAEEPSTADATRLHRCASFPGIDRVAHYRRNVDSFPFRSNMANNEEAGGSGSKPFWMLTDEMEVMESQPRRDDGEDDGTDPEYRADDAAEDDTTDGAAEDDTTDGAAEDDTGAPKKLRRERRPNVLSTVKQAFTEVNASGHPTAPPDLVKGYSAQLGCILRSTVSINTENLRHPDRANLRTLLFKKLHERYEFPVDCSEKRLMRNKVHNAALTKMSTALASWRNRVKKMINSGASYDKIKESNPSITEQDYADFKIKCESESTSDSSQWGKDMRKLNLGTHKLGPGGFRAAQPKWDAADEERVKNGLEPLFSQYKNKQTRNFLLARYRIDPKTKELTTTPEVKEFETLLAKEIAAESEKEASSGAGSTSSSQCAPWDNPLNRALNAHKKRDPLSKPTSAGRVAGEGCSMKWSDYYKSGKKERKAPIDEKEVAQLKAQVAQIPTLVEEQVRQQVQQIVETQQRTQRQQVEDQVGTTLSSIIPTLVAGLDEWYRGGKKGPPPVPSFTGSNSHNVEPSVSPQAATMVSPAAPTLVAPAAPTLVAPAAPTLVSPAAPTLVSPAAPLLQLNAPVAADNTPPGTAPTSGHSISCTPAAGGASTLAELDAITSSAVDVPCTLLHFVNGELIDVAKAKIVQPSNRQLHGRPMQPDVYRIQLVRVLSGYDDVVPPFQPHGADEDEVLTLQHCFNWSMVWPKSQIRLGARGTTPQTTPPALPAPSHGKTTPTVPPSADEDMQMAQDEDMQMAQDPNDGPYEDSTFANLDCNFDFGVDYDLSSQPSQAAAEGKTYCNKRRLFSSQETPPAADFTETQPKAGVRSVISPNTLKKACAEENAVPVNTKPKGRKRKKKDDKSASQPAPIRAQDGPPVPKNIEARVHVSGERMLIKRLYDAAPGPMRSLVDGIQFMEERRIREKDHGYPVYIAKVPSGHGFVDSDFAAKIFLRYDDIFAMLNSYPLHYTFIRLYSLSKAMRIIRDHTPGIAIADPFYMRAVHLATAGDRAVASEYLKGFFLANQKKYNLLLPVFPEDNTCTLISVTPRHSMATYLDADGKSSTDYTNVKAVLDDALNGYVKAKGHMERPNVRYGKHVFKHQTKFPCVKKPPSSTKDAYYALYHMNKFIRDQQQLTLPEHLRDWANKLARVPDDGIKQDFFRIQTEFCEIIHQDVIRSAGEFYAGYQPSNSDIDTMLQMQGDDYRSWMCLKKGGGFIHAPSGKS
ncbi:hypothetical protein QYE76_002578 [Lolium multiflorum]|uniref:DUF4218 domain-containing protein n=1 Tax=Lolium multiflorum TaxID=4521 RepID=A0AAD8W0F3_LOLMU|nr:hypothetical protein QYE76_002578 [Lolium multiflorum]